MLEPQQLQGIVNTDRFVIKSHINHWIYLDRNMRNLNPVELTLEHIREDVEINVAQYQLAVKEPLEDVNSSPTTRSIPKQP